jgi:type IV pilus assembly protein PilN
VIRTNLSTRPFYNERAVHTWLLLAAAVVAVMTAFNVTRVLRYSRSDTRLAGEAARDEGRAGQFRQQAALLRSSVDPRQIDFASTEARQANELIDRRTFSWTELFNKFETTLPDDVRITSVRPLIDKQRGIVVDIAVVARGFDDVKTFMDRLQATGAFKGLGPVEEHYEETGLLVSSLEAIYIPDAGRPVGHQGATRR